MFIHYPNYTQRIPNVSPVLIVGGPIFEVIFGLAYRGAIFGILRYAMSSFSKTEERALYTLINIFYCFPPKWRCIENEASKQKRERFILDAPKSRRDTVQNFIRVQYKTI